MKVPDPRKLPSGNWFIRLRLGGESIPITDPNKNKCITRAEHIKAEYRDGKRIVTDSSDKTLGQLIDDYIDKYEPDLSPATIRGYSSIRKNRFQNEMSKRPKDINFQKMVNKELEKVSIKTVKNGWGAVTAALLDAKIPLPGVKFPAEDDPDGEGRMKFLEPDDIPLFLAAAEGDLCEVELLLELHSLRASEAVKVIKDRQYDLKNGLIFVRGAVVPDKNNQRVEKKAGKSRAARRRIPIMIPRLAQLLKKYEEKGEGPGTHAPSTVLRHCYSVCEKAGINAVSNHDLRRTFASLAYSLGFSEEMIMEWGGWDDPGTMHKIYIYLTKREREKADNDMKSFYAPKTQSALEETAMKELMAWCEKYAALDKFSPIFEVVRTMEQEASA